MLLHNKHVCAVKARVTVKPNYSYSPIIYEHKKNIEHAQVVY